MHDAHHFLTNLALVLCIAALTTAVFQKLRQPIVLGYLLAGAIVGPHTPFPLFADEETIHAFSEFGVMLLMFALGLEFSIAKLVRVGPTSGMVAVIECSLMVSLGYIAAAALGWTRLESLYTGAFVAISSTTIIVKAFAEQNVKGRLTEIVFGILIVEDLIAIVLLAVLTTISAGSELTPAGLASTVGRLAAFLAVMVCGGVFVVPRLMRAVVRLDRPETTVVASVGLCFGFALVASAVGYSVALGAFLAGVLVAESGEAEVILPLVLPVRDIFAAIFFISVGMLIDPALVLAHWGAVLLLTAVVVTGKIVGISLGVFLTGEGVPTSLRTGMSLAQIGEFSFLIAAVGLASGATRPFLYPLAVSISAITTLLTPWLIRASGPAADALDRWLPKPVQTFASLYGTWVEQLRGRPRAATEGRRLRRLTGLLLLDATLFAAVVIATSVWGKRVAEFFLSGALPSADARHILVLLVALALALPFAIGIASCTAGLARGLGAVAFPVPDSGTDPAAAPRRAFVVTVEIAILLLVGIPLIALTSPFVPALSGSAMLAAILFLLALALWRSATNLQAHARAGAEAIAEVLAKQLAGPAAEDDSDLERLHRLLPGLGAPRPVAIAPDSRAVGRTLSEIRLRGRSGATVLAILREHDEVLVPTGREILRAGDLLALAGTAAAIENARQLLAKTRRDAAPADSAGSPANPRDGAPSPSKGEA